MLGTRDYHAKTSILSLGRDSFVGTPPLSTSSFEITPTRPLNALPFTPSSPIARVE